MTDKQENIKVKVLEAYENGNICYTTFDGVQMIPFKEFIKQPLDGMLYDINRNSATILAMLGKGDIKWINDYALTRLVEYFAEEKQWMIEKACEWLRENLITYAYDPEEEFVERFKKAMEE